MWGVSKKGEKYMSCQKYRMITVCEASTPPLSGYVEVRVTAIGSSGAEIRLYAVRGGREELLKKCGSATCSFKGVLDPGTYVKAWVKAYRVWRARISYVEYECFEFVKWRFYRRMNGRWLPWMGERSEREVEVFVPHRSSCRAVALYSGKPLPVLVVDTNLGEGARAVMVDGELVATPKTYVGLGCSLRKTLEALEKYVKWTIEEESLEMSTHGGASSSWESKREVKAGDTITFRYKVWTEWGGVLCMSGKSGRLSIYVGGKKIATLSGSGVFSKVVKNSGKLKLVLSAGYCRRGWFKSYYPTYAEIHDLKAGGGQSYSFAKWVVYDSKGDVVLDAPRTIEVVVPAGERYTAVAYYGSSPSLLLVNSSPAGVGITVNGSTIETTPFYLALAGKNLEASRVMI